MSEKRPQIPVAYRTAVNKIVVEALEAVFNANYPEGQFQNINISPPFALEDIKYPAIIVNYRGQRIKDAGVGNVEYFPDPVGLIRAWNHALFWGSIEFQVYAESPVDRDQLFDALVELLMFGRLTDQLNQFFVRVYGDPSAPYNPLMLLNQLALMVKDIEEGPNTANLAPWQPEDVLIYSTSLTINCFGGFYNSIPPADGEALRYVDRVDVLPYQEDDPIPNPDPTDPAPWSPTFDYVDVGVVGGTGTPS